MTTPSISTHMAKTIGRESVTNRLLAKKMIPMMICNKPDSIRVPLLGRNCWVWKVNTILEMPENSVKKPMSQAVAKSVAAGLAMHNTPNAMRRMPEMTSQIFVLVFMGLEFRFKCGTKVKKNV